MHRFLKLEICTRSELCLFVLRQYVGATEHKYLLRCSRLSYLCINLVGTYLMGHNSIQPWHYGFCDLSHAQSAVKESKKAAQAAHTTAAWWRRRRGSGFFVGRRQSGQARHGQAGEGMAWGTILTGHGVMNGASEIFFLFNWRCQKPFIHCTANSKWFHELLLLLQSFKIF